MQQTTDNQDELFVIVDENDTIIGYKTRRECHADPSLIHRSIGVAIFNDAGEILLQKRSSTKDTHPGKWTISAGGHVGKGQSYEEAARRELQEELGIEADLTFVTKSHHVEKDEQEMTVLFSTTYNGSFTINSEEVEEVRFISRDEISSIKDALTPCASENLTYLNLL